MGLQQLSESQQKILRYMLGNQHVATVEDLVAHLKVTRTAIVQHLNTLERDHFVEKRSFLRSLKAGRPSREYSLASKGLDLFPKQYSWFSALLLELVKKQSGTGGLVAGLQSMARNLEPMLTSQVSATTDAQRITETVKIMNSLSYEAVDVSSPSTKPNELAIEAHNCVFHHLANEYNEVCEFDLEILRILTRLEPKHTECMVRGGKSCRFTFTKPQSKSESKS